MITNIIIGVLIVLVIAIDAWIWWFENGGDSSDDDDNN